MWFIDTSNKRIVCNSFELKILSKYRKYYSDCTTVYITIV